MTHRAQRYPFRLAALALASLVAACGGGGEAPQQTAAATPSTTAPSAGAAATAAPQGAQTPGADRINLSQCSSTTDGKVFFQVGDAVLGIPAQTIRDAIPTSLNPPMDKEKVMAELRRQASQGGGCPEKPISARLLLIQTTSPHPLLDGNIGLLADPPQGLTSQFARLTQGLQDKPNANCRNISDDLMGCIGTETRGTIESQVMYVVTTDRSQKLASGGPLAARCVLDGDSIRGCNIVDQLPGNVAFDATLKAGTYSVASLRQARDQAAAQINGLRR